MSGKNDESLNVEKVPKLPSLDGLNWLLHLYFIRKDFKSCRELIKEQITVTNGNCEYALYVHGKHIVILISFFLNTF